MMRYVVMVIGGGLVACGGEAPSEPPTTGPVSTATAEAVCEVDCQRQLDCGSTSPLEDCVDACVEHAADRLREDFFDAWSECRAAQACAATDACDACLPTPVHRNYETRCRALFLGCGASPDEVDVICGRGEPSDYTLCMLSTDILAELVACVTMSDCVAAYACTHDVFTAHGIR